MPLAIGSAPFRSRTGRRSIERHVAVRRGGSALSNGNGRHGTPPPPSNGSVHRDRSTALRITRALEKAWGVPQPRRRALAPLDALVATILSQHTSDANSARAYRELKRRFPRWGLVAGSSPEDIAEAIRCGGLADQKALRIHQILQGLDGRFDMRQLRRMPNETALEHLCALDGVGIKTAACVLLFSLGRDVFPVDVHVHRVLTRVGLAHNSKSPEQTYERMVPAIPPGRAYSLHVNLVRLGRSLCRPTRPQCRRCPLLSMCSFASGKENPRVSRGALNR